MTRGELPQQCKYSSAYKQINQYAILIERREKKTYMIISIDTEKSFDKIQHFFMTKTSNELVIEDNFLNFIKEHT